MSHTHMHTHTKFSQSPYKVSSLFFFEMVSQAHPQEGTHERNTKTKLLIFTDPKKTVITCH